MITYAIKINGKYFKDYVYATKSTIGRCTGPAGGQLISEGDIIDIVCTDNPERTEVKRSIGNTIATLYTIEKLANQVISIEPQEGNKYERRK